MFCLDFALSFAFYGKVMSEARERGFGGSLLAFPCPLFVGALSGAFAATALYPFDIVRQMAVPGGKQGKPVFAVSSIPFAALYFGLYFRPGGDEAPFGERIARAFGATAAALAAELPFDQAKISLAGGLRPAALFSLLRLPFSAFLLVAFETATAPAKTGRLPPVDLGKVDVQGRASDAGACVPSPAAPARHERIRS